MSTINTGLPDGTEDFVGIKAKELEALRNSLLAKFYKNDYQLVIPSLIEFSDSIGGDANDSLRDFSYCFSDDASSKEISIRPDISQQIARIDIQQGAKGKKKYCYFGETLRKTTDSLTKSRTAFKAGVELFGKISIADEMSILNLLISCIKSTGKKKITLSLGRTEPLLELIDSLKLNLNNTKKLKNIMSSKSQTDLEEFCKPLNIKRNFVLELKNLMLVNGSIDSLKYLKKHKNKKFQESAKKLERVVKSLPKSIDYHFEFSDFPGFDYHDGLVFSIHAEGFGSSLAKGGHYKTRFKDNIIREALGFDINISSLIKNIKQ